MKAKDQLIQLYIEERMSGKEKEVSFQFALSKLLVDFVNVASSYLDIDKSLEASEILKDLKKNVIQSGISLTQELEFEYQAQKQGLSI